MPQRLVSLSTGRALFLLDLLAVALLWPAALWLMHGRDAGAGWAAALLYPAADLAALYALGLYRRDVALEVRRSLGRVPLAAAGGAVGAGSVLAALGLAGGGVVPAVQAAACFLLTGALARVLFDVLRRHGLFSRALLVVGAGRRAWDLVWMLRKEGMYLNYRILFVHSAELGEVDPRLADGCWGEVAPLPPDGFLGAARRFVADSIVVAPDERRGLKLEGLLACKIAGIPVLQYLSFIEKETRRVDMKRMELSWLLYSDGFIFGIADRMLKRTLDLVVSSAVLLLASPFLLAAVLVIKLEDGGPALYRQVRITRGGRPFRINKLRTMRVDAECGGAVWAAQGDAAHHPDRRLPAPDPAGRGAAVAQRAARGDELRGATAGAPGFRGDAGGGDPLVPGAARRQGRADRVGAGQLPLRGVHRRRAEQAELRLVLREELLGAVRPAHHRADDQGRALAGRGCGRGACGGSGRGVAASESDVATNVRADGLTARAAAAPPRTRPRGRATWVAHVMRACARPGSLGGAALVRCSQDRAASRSPLFNTSFRW